MSILCVCKCNIANKEIGKCRPDKKEVTALKTLKKLSQRKKEISVKKRFLRTLTENLPRALGIP